MIDEVRTGYEEEVEANQRRRRLYEGLTDLQKLLHRPLDSFEDDLQTLTRNSANLILFDSTDDRDTTHPNLIEYQRLRDSVAGQPEYLGEVVAHTEEDDPDGAHFWKGIYNALGIREDTTPEDKNTLLERIRTHFKASPNPGTLFIRGLEHLSADDQSTLRAHLQAQRGYKVYTYSDSKRLDKSAAPGHGTSELGNMFHPFDTPVSTAIEAHKALLVQNLYKKAANHLDTHASSQLFLPQGMGKTIFAQTLATLQPHGIEHITMEGKSFLELPQRIEDKIVLIDEAQALSYNQMVELTKRYPRIIFLENELERNAEVIDAFETLTRPHTDTEPDYQAMAKGVFAITRALLYPTHSERLRFVDADEERWNVETNNGTDFSGSLYSTTQSLKESLDSLSTPPYSTIRTSMVLPDGHGDLRLNVGVDESNQPFVALSDVSDDPTIKEAFEEHYNRWIARRNSLLHQETTTQEDD